MTSYIVTDFSSSSSPQQIDIDKELNEMILKNQQRLAELQSDIKEVNKIAGEPVVNIRKIKNAHSKNIQTLYFSRKIKIESSVIPILQKWFEHL